MIEVDFLMIYEHKVRELENLCLLKYELDRRGYRTKILYIDSEESLKAFKPVYHAKVVMVMACYRSSTLEWHTKDYIRFDKVINLQWEQAVPMNQEEDKNGFRNFSGIAKEVVHISWGKANRNRLINIAGIPERKVKLTGHIGMDFLRPEFAGYYMTREELFEKFGIPADKKVCLFISTFKPESVSAEFLEEMCKRYGDSWRITHEISVKTQKTILEWITKIVDEDKDVFFVYRPHPSEVTDELLELQNRYPNMRIIGEYSVHQWILACDLMFSWISTCIVDVFFARKMCYILRPYDMPRENELRIYQDADEIVNYEQFEEAVKRENYNFPIHQEVIGDYYDIDWNRASYLRLADAAEEVYKDDYYKLGKRLLKSYRTSLDAFEKVKRKMAQVTFVYDLYERLLDNEQLDWKWIDKLRKQRDNLSEIIRIHQNEMTTQEEIEEIVERIARVLEQREEK